MISSVQPRCPAPPYTLAVSKKLMPWSSAESMMPWASDSSACGPKFMVPRQSRETFRPERPKWVYCIGESFRGRACRGPGYSWAGYKLDGLHLGEGGDGGIRALARSGFERGDGRKLLIRKGEGRGREVFPDPGSLAG